MSAIPTHICHQCNQRITPYDGLKCPLCHDDFIERVWVDTNEWSDDIFTPDEEEDEEYIDMFQHLGYEGGLNEFQDTIHIQSTFNNFLNASLGIGLSDIGIHGNLGDYGVGRNLDDILHQTFEQQPISGPPPASKKVVDKLKAITIAQNHVEVSLECTVCKDKFLENEECKVLPCDHFFHGDCIMPWLGIHNTCPICRYELPTDDTDYEKAKELRNKGKSAPSTITTTTTMTTTTTTTPTRPAPILIIPTPAPDDTTTTATVDTTSTPTPLIFPVGEPTRNGKSEITTNPPNKTKRKRKKKNNNYNNPNINHRVGMNGGGNGQNTKKECITNNKRKKGNRNNNNTNRNINTTTCNGRKHIK